MYTLISRYTYDGGDRKIPFKTVYVCKCIHSIEQRVCVLRLADGQNVYDVFILQPSNFGEDLGQHAFQYEVGVIGNDRVGRPSTSKIQRNRDYIASAKSLSSIYFADKSVVENYHECCQNVLTDEFVGSEITMLLFFFIQVFSSTSLICHAGLYFDIAGLNYELFRIVIERVLQST